MNVFFDVDGTIIGANDGKLRPLVREVFEQLRADGHAIYIWSGVGIRWVEIDRHELRTLIETCFHKPMWNHHARLAALEVTPFPDFVVDDHAEVVEAFGGVTVSPFYYFDPDDREMERVYRAVQERAGQHGNGARRPPSESALVAASWDSVAEVLLGEARELRIHSLFERALNLVTPSGELLGLVGPRAGNGPATIVLAEPPNVELDRIGLTPGDPARAADGWLRIGDRLVVDLSRARRWEPAPTPLTLRPDDAMARLARAERVAGESAPAGGLAPLLPYLAELGDDTPPDRPNVGGVSGGVSALAWAVLRALLPAWRRDDADGVHEAATRIVGLGPGLTPSGDDLLAGLLVGTARLRGALPTALGEAVLAAAWDRTTDFAVARLRHAAHGAIEEVQEHIMANLLGGAGTELDAAVRRAAGWGHTSGVDTLVGLFLALRTELSVHRR